MITEEGKQVALSVCKAIVETLHEGCILTADGLLHKKIDGQWIAKPSVQTKELKRVWIDENI